MLRCFLLRRCLGLCWSSSSRRLCISIYNKEITVNSHSVTLVGKELSDDSCFRTSNVNHYFISLHYCDDFILLYKLSEFLRIFLHRTFRNGISHRWHFNSVRSEHLRNLQKRNMLARHNSASKIFSNEHVIIISPFNLQGFWGFGVLGFWGDRKRHV